MTTKDKEWVTGTVIKGSGRGRAIGFPTTNIAVAQTNLPSEGVWAAWAKLDDDTFYKAALHVGPRPTFDDERLSVELHLLDFPDRNLHGRTINALPVKKLRDIQKFDSIEALVAAMKQDCRKADVTLSQQHPA